MAAIHQREKDELKRILAQRGHQDIDSTLQILDAFLSTEEHLTKAELRQRLKAGGHNFPMEQIGTALDLFCRYGFAQVKRFADKENRYEHRHLGQHHDHMVCTRCGRVEEFVNEEMENLQTRIASSQGFVPLQHRMEIYGLCVDCAKSRECSRPLSCAECGEKLIVSGHAGGEQATRRLIDMGLTPGTKVEVLQRNGGPLVVSCRGCRLALGRGLSEKILVTPDGSDQDGKE